MNTRQKGAALLISLMMLVILTLLGISAVNMSTINFKIIGNRQASMESSVRTQNAIETILSDINYFSNPGTNEIVTFTDQISGDTQNINVTPRRCYNKKTAPGYSLTWGLAPEDSNWEVVANYTDNSTGANATIHQGVKIRMTSGSCPQATP